MYSVKILVCSTLENFAQLVLQMEDTSMASFCLAVHAWHHDYLPSWLFYMNLFTLSGTVSAPEVVRTGFRGITGVSLLAT